MIYLFKFIENLTTLDFGLLESALVDERKQSIELIPIESHSTSSINEKFTTHSDIAIRNQNS